jgi:hypothetical protein
LQDKLSIYRKASPDRVSVYIYLTTHAVLCGLCMIVCMLHACRFISVMSETITYLLTCSRICLNLIHHASEHPVDYAGQTRFCAFQLMVKLAQK